MRGFNEKLNVHLLFIRTRRQLTGEQTEAKKQKYNGAPIENIRGPF